MQVFGLPGHIIRNAGRASRLLGAKTPTIEAERRRDAVARWRRAMRDGLDAGQAARAVGVPRSTLYRWESAPEPKSRRPHRVRANGWSPTLRAEVERLRLDFPFWGKDKLGPVLRKAGFAVSNATVGRILKKLVERGRVTPVPELIRKAGRKSPPKIRPHAIRKPKDVCFEKPGDVIQIDTLTLTIAPGRTVKHFDAYDVFAKWTVAKPYAQATAANAADFLAKVTAEMPWPIKAIQIDGGSEFMAEFETACQDNEIPLYVLPPRSPKLNGAVERCNGAWRYEFYATVDLPTQIDKIAQHVDAFQHLYNHHRPHGALDGLTPSEYLKICRDRMTQPSHMY
ncbi:integrase core domain-containing protein [Mesorhizobium sp. M1050]|uniref:integrase core domain-containing protein n=1 Tax=Mesorhizobium sp. M1050 TaxID=2957051 RepID=UPI00333A6DDA